jgi:hypothetical protein
MILYCSSMMTGGHHNNQLPVVLLGRGGGRIRTGRVLDYLQRPNRRRIRDIQEVRNGRKGVWTLLRYEKCP